VRDEPKRFNPHVGCEGKQLFQDFVEATKAAKRTNRHHDDAMVGPYRCTLCHRWHVGSHEWGRENNKRAKAKRRGPFTDSEQSQC
jgi:hypothetical protein